MTGWTMAEKNMLAVAAAAAPSVHNTRPWTLELGGERRVAEIYELLDRALPRHDPLGRDRLISCGAALEHVRVAANVLGNMTTTELFPDVTQSGLAGRVTATGKAEPSDADLAAHGAMSRRRSHRGPFRRTRVSTGLTARILAANRTDGVELRVVGDADAEAVANVLGHSALVLRNDGAYQRELNAWTSSVRDPLPGDGVSAATRRTATLPWVGLVRATTAVPDLPTLVERLRAELLVLVQTPDDGPADHMRAGMAVEAVWLAAVGAGLAGAVLTQPFQVRESRAGLIEALNLNGFPQILLRLGFPRHHSEER
ncbi:Acg family FMN-binding oxidoreductase [Actinophytocola sp. NPDC049390]|uniref:Acg family FMN-binding oxidoreductase n=1 Tax=Actinophytocola sp. NPDC049390 TaxID=3363894 RepID=UPI003791F750